MKSVKYLERLKDVRGLKTDGQLAEVLGITRGAVNHYCTGKRIMDEETCLAVALALELDPMIVIMAAGMDRAEKAGQKSLWEVFSQRMAATAATAILASGVTLFLTPGDAQASTTGLTSSLAGDNIDYAKLHPD